MWYLYAIQSSKDGRLYVGISQDPDARLKEHNRGAVTSTQFYKPWKRVYLESCQSREQARILEKYYKSGSGKEKLKSKIKSEG